MKRLTFYLLLSIPLIAFGQVSVISPMPKAHFVLILNIPDEPPIGCVALQRSFNPRTEAMSYYRCTTQSGEVVTIHENVVDRVIHNPDYDKKGVEK